MTFLNHKFFCFVFHFQSRQKSWNIPTETNIITTTASVIDTSSAAAAIMNGHIVHSGGGHNNEQDPILNNLTTFNGKLIDPINNQMCVLRITK